ncbi:heparinase II/III family protein [Pseudomonas sp. KNUC1026]|uniref:heparinase II/III family protein n=1 Tax=Pseudomonas sp. KNUC1026 TaxID=2893890 RepID=UPI001F3FE856|nr:heparinase II/III-family protein [Pseudomonas sp. KNUC1026]UFH48242.1 heparinase II/III-family protein [Pseudomonas sp. KNUC1026]
MSTVERLLGYSRLGWLNIAKVLRYRASIKWRLSAAQRIKAQLPCGPYFSAPTSNSQRVKTSFAWENVLVFFGKPVRRVGDLTSPPAWHKHPLSGSPFSNHDRPWWTITDFDNRNGDIKAYWEFSRMGWVTYLAQGVASEVPGALQALNLWIEDWCVHNPVNIGPNWKCGQEASFRVLHLCAATLLLDNREHASKALLELIKIHLERIAPTTGYALAQDNNHGTSEAAALYVGGSLLQRHGHRRGEALRYKGQLMLEERAKSLIADDGTFSQYSVNYHRLMLDTYSFAEHWRSVSGHAPFKPTTYDRLRRATDWLAAMVMESSGDAPNIGANDGAHIINLSACDYRDFRPSLQLASVLFRHARAFGEGSWNLGIHWLNIAIPERRIVPGGSTLMDDGGFSTCRDANHLLVLRFARFSFRPSQADILHLDYWHNGQNLLGDGGTFSYNDAQWSDYFSGVKAHNTAEFDDRDQMPRLSRFLYGRWPNSYNVSSSADGMAASYTDYKGCSHSRRVSQLSDGLKVVDTLSGFKSCARLRWRLPPGDWMLGADTVSCGSVRYAFEADVEFTLVLEQGWASTHYLQRHAVPVIEVAVRAPGNVTMTLSIES